MWSVKELLFLYLCSQMGQRNEMSDWTWRSRKWRLALDLDRRWLLQRRHTKPVPVGTIELENEAEEAAAEGEDDPKTSQAQKYMLGCSVTSPHRHIRSNLERNQSAKVGSASST